MQSNKLHRPLVNEVVNNLNVIFNQNKYADRVIERSLRNNHTWGSRDRAFIAENTYDIVRWIRLYQYCLTGYEAMKPLKQNQFFAVLAIHFMLKNVELPNWPEFDGINYKLVMQRKYEALKIRKIKCSIPDWLDEMGEKELGDGWEQEMNALNEVAPFVIRTNTLATNKGKLIKDLAALKVEAVSIDGYDDALKIINKTNLFKSELFQNGHFEVQDASSQLVAAFMQLEPGMKVIDACAGAGGKTLHIASLMQNKGKIVSMDVEDYKLTELKKRARRANVNNVETRLIEGENVIKELANYADRLLIDAPCSGLGVIKRNPDAKWKLQPAFIENIKATQAQILEQYQTMLKVGGKMAYVTCSIMPSENASQVQHFLSNHPNFILVDEKIVLPSATGFDGFYMALLEKQK
ncbi:MAG: RsmB/NOP family class I SAM-dependent RNA methyltransferase [Bacteroidota bacterium]